MSVATVPKLNLLDYQPPMSLWQLVEDHVHHTHEQQEIKRILGESLIDQSLELHDEVTTLVSIWQEVREQATSGNNHMKFGLPEPPQQRERLVQEICFFAENVREKAKKQGVDPDEYLARHNNMNVIDYALGTSRPSSSRTSRTSPMSARVVSPNERTASSICKEVHSMSKKFNYLHLDDVLQNLRQRLQEEIEVLLRDITFLQECLDEEMSLQAPRGWESISREPTLTELKKERAALEEELLMPETTIPVPPPKNKPSFDPKTVLRMHPVTAPVGRSDHPNSAEGSRPRPVKATHTINGTMTPDSTQCKECRSPSQVSLQDITVLDKPFRKRTVSPSRVKVVSVRSILSHDGTDSSPEHASFIPSPPTPTKPVTNRPSSADKFRKLVLECRDGT